MRKILFFILLLNFVFSEELLVHYIRTDNDYNNKGLWYWGDTNGGKLTKWPVDAKDILSKNNGEALYSIDIKDNAKDIGLLIVDKKTEEKDGGDRKVLLNNLNSKKEIWIYQGNSDVYYKPINKLKDETNVSNYKYGFEKDFEKLSWREDEFKNLRIYQIMVEAHKDSDDKGFKDGWGPSNHKGDLKGITNSLDYIKSLNMNAIWLTPIFKSESVSDKLEATGYFSDSYYDIDDRFGTKEDLKELVNEAHKKGMYVFLDGVFGHHGSSKIEGIVDGAPQGEGFEIKYPESLGYFEKVIEYWMEEFEIDGWRLDQAYQLNQNGHNYLYDIRQKIENVAISRDKRGEKWGTLGYAVGEIWDGSGNDIINKGFKDNGLISFFDFPMRYTLVQTLAIQENTTEPWAQTNDVSKINDTFKITNKYPNKSIMNLMITNHDLVRFGNLLKRAKITDYGTKEYWDRHKLAIAFLGAYTGTVTLYYGDEYGAYYEGYNKNKDLGFYDDHISRDEEKTDNFTEDEQDLINYTKKIMDIRSKYKSLYLGNRQNIESFSKIYIDKKEYKDEVVYYIMNLNDKDKYVEIKDLKTVSKVKDIISDEILEVENGKINVKPKTAYYLVPII